MVEGRVDVELEHVEVVGEGIVHQFAAHGYACVLHHYIHSASLLLQLQQQLLCFFAYFLKLGHIERQYSDSFWRGAGLGDSLEFFGVACCEDDVCAQSAELVGKLLSDARRCTSDPNGLSSEIRLGFPAPQPPSHCEQHQYSHQCCHYHLQQSVAQSSPTTSLLPSPFFSHTGKWRITMAYRKHLNSIGMQKSSSFYTHSRNSSGITDSRGPSPHSRTKIKLVSPLKNMRVTPKENHPPSATAQNFYTKSSKSIELGGKSILNQTSQASFMRSSKPVIQAPPESIFKKAPQICLGQPVIRVQSPQRAVSPQRICFNNKSFDIGAIRSQVVFVTPLHHPRTSMPINATCNSLSHPAWPTELVIQQENAMEELKESYESELREPQVAKEPFDIELKEIQQLQKEIAENNLQIKELLNSSRVSRDLNSSRLRPSEENFAADLLSQTQPLQFKNEQHAEIEPLAPQVSVQTDEPSMPLEQNESRWSKFSISRSKECQIQLLCSREKQQTSRVKEEEKTDNQEAKSIKEQTKSVKSQVNSKKGSRQLIQSRVSQREPKEVVLDRPSSENELGGYAINLNLKASRACSEASAIQYSRFQIDFQQNNQPTPKKQIPTQKQIVPEQPQPTGVAEVVSSVISSGKRRINNSIYL